MEFGLSKSHQRNEKVEKRIQTALDWLDARSTEELLAEPIGPKVIADGVELRFQEYDTRDYAEMTYETHRDHIDIHYMITGAEWVRWADEGTADAVSPYDPEEEIQRFGHPAFHSKALLEKAELFSDISENKICMWFWKIYLSIFPPFSLHFSGSSR